MVIGTDYEVLSILGEGSFGKVFKAHHRQRNEDVAIKRIKVGSKSWDSACKSKELTVLRTVRHNFIVRLHELIRSPKDGSLYYVFEYIDSDLSKVIMQHAKGVAESFAVSLIRQLLVALAYMHQQGFFHRDVKPENVLFKTADQTIRLADFGEARSLRARPPFTEYVGTRWYRAPECLLGDTAYSSVVDIWAAGLIFAELLRGSPLFPGTSSLDQLYKIFDMLGPADNWPGLTRLAEVVRFRVPKKKGSGLQRALPSGTSQDMHAALLEILTLSPRNRPLARACLGHSLFASLPEMHLEALAAPRPTGSPEVGDSIMAPESPKQLEDCTDQWKENRRSSNCRDIMESSSERDASTQLVGAEDHVDLDWILSQDPGLHSLLSPESPDQESKSCPANRPDTEATRPDTEVESKADSDRDSNLHPQKQLDLDAEIDAILGIGKAEENALLHIDADAETDPFPLAQLSHTSLGKHSRPGPRKECDAAPLSSPCKEVADGAPVRTSMLGLFSSCRRRGFCCCLRSRNTVEAISFSSVCPGKCELCLDASVLGAGKDI